MRLTEFWRRMEVRFGDVYAHSVSADYRLPQLEATADEALARGVPPKIVWQAICEEFEVPSELH